MQCWRRCTRGLAGAAGTLPCTFWQKSRKSRAPACSAPHTEPANSACPQIDTGDPCRSGCPQSRTLAKCGCRGHTSKGQVTLSTTAPYAMQTHRGPHQEPPRHRRDGWSEGSAQNQTGAERWPRAAGPAALELELAAGRAGHTLMLHPIDKPAAAAAAAAAAQPFPASGVLMELLTVGADRTVPAGASYPIASNIPPGPSHLAEAD
mmetsp:Transcript_43778/g.95381  ORF Transcript_43778/g.95381 Transcript_43778/m.95381 type:complete len:206 (-) Transcript_43778:374-991(-)